MDMVYTLSMLTQACSVCLFIADGDDITGNIKNYCHAEASPKHLRR